MHGEVSITDFGVFYPINRKNFRLPSMRDKTKALKSDGSNLKAYGGASGSPTERLIPSACYKMVRFVVYTQSPGALKTCVA